MISIFSSIKKRLNILYKLIFAVYRAENYFISKLDENLFEVIANNDIRMEFKKYTKSYVVSVYFNDELHFKYRFITNNYITINQIKDEANKNILVFIEKDQVEFVIKHLKSLRPSGDFRTYFKNVSSFHKKYKMANEFKEDLKSKIHMYPYFDFSFKSINKDIVIFKISNLVKKNEVEFIKFRDKLLIKTKFSDLFSIVNAHIYAMDYKNKIEKIKESVNLDNLHFYFNYHQPVGYLSEIVNPSFILLFNNSIFNNNLLFSDNNKCYRYNQKNNNISFNLETNNNSTRFVCDFFINEIFKNIKELKKEYPSVTLINKIRDLGLNNNSLPLTDDVIDIVDMYDV